MIDREALKIYIYPNKKRITGTSADTQIKRPDGMIEFYETFKGTERIYKNNPDFQPITYISHIEIPVKGLEVTVCLSGHQEKISPHWEPFLVTLNEFFQNIDERIKQYFIDYNRCFDMDLGIFNEETHMSAQDDIFIEKYTDWPYLLFEYKYSSIQSLRAFSDTLEKEYNLYDTYDRDWAETKVFFKDFTVENLTKIFLLLIKLEEINNSIANEVIKLKERLFTDNSKDWFKILSTFKVGEKNVRTKVGGGKKDTSGKRTASKN